MIRQGYDMETTYLDTPLKIDRRPLWRVLADRTVRYQALAGLVTLCVILWHLTPPSGLSAAGYHSLIVFGGCVVVWVTGLLPPAATSLMALALLPLLGIMGRKETFALFGNEAVFFILGAFILGAALTGTGLSSRLARAVLGRFGKTPRSLALTVFSLSAVLSFLMSEHAVAAMMFTVVSEIVASLGLRPGKSSYGRLLFMSIGWGCVIGGIATFLGGARAPLAVGMLKEKTGIEFTFFEWTLAAAPLVIALLIAGFILLVRSFPPDIESVEEGARFLNRKRLEMGRITWNEKITAMVVLVTLAAWMTLGGRVGMAPIALLAVVALFVFRVVTWQAIEEYVNWGVILMYGGAIALAAALEKNGAAQWMVDRWLDGLGASPLVLVGVISLVSIILTECISNAAVIAILMPVGLTLASGMGMDPRIMTLAITLPAGLAYCLPMGTPANAIIFSSGHLTAREMIFPGAVIMVISWLLFMASAIVVWPLIGLGF